MNMLNVTAPATTRRIVKKPFEDSVPLLSDPEALREKAEREGFLFFKQLLPREPILALRAEILGIIQRYGWLTPGQDPLLGLIEVEAINRIPADQVLGANYGITIDAYNDVQKLESFHRLPHHPILISAVQTLFGEEVFVHPRHVARTITPHKALVPTPPHQDFPHIQGTSKTWTCWFPLGNCPREMGGLSVLKGSNHNGYIPVVAAKGAGGLAVRMCPSDVEWMEDDYQVGDVLLFNSFTVHKALPSRFKDRIRLSVDVRYQPLSEPIEVAALSPHGAVEGRYHDHESIAEEDSVKRFGKSFGWEDIYKDWQRDDLKYYWRKRGPQQLMPWDDRYRQPGRRIC
jgi:hypothetical protein